MTQLSLPIPPSSNRYFRIWRGRAVRTEAANAYRNLVFIRAKNAKLPKISQPRLVAVQLDWYREMKAGDLDNRAKVLL